MHILRQQNGPTTTGTAQVNPFTHGDSGTRSQSSSVSHSAVQSGEYSLPAGSCAGSGTCRQVRDAHSSAGDAITDVVVVPPSASPRKHLRPTGLSEQAARMIMVSDSATKPSVRQLTITVMLLNVAPDV